MKHLKAFSLGLLLCCLTLSLVSAQWFPPYYRVKQERRTVTSQKTIFETAKELPTLKSFVDFISSSGYEPVVKTLNNTELDLTLLAPNNDAFAFVEPDPSHVDILTHVLEYHVLNGSLLSSDMDSLNFAPTILYDDDFVSLNGTAQVMQIIKALGKVTIPFGIPGDLTFTATVSMADVQCSNGVIHVVDKILLPPNMTAVVAYRAGLTTFLTLMHHFDLLDVFDNQDNLTVFIPSNEAFYPIDLTRFTHEQIRTVLLYHAIPSVYYSPNLSSGNFQTLSGDFVKISVSHFGTKVNTACVKRPNILASNGVVHMIDSLLIPPRLQYMLDTDEKKE